MSAKMKRLLLIPIIVILALSSFPSLAYAPIIPHEYTLDIPCYAPTKITFNYAYTHNHSISDISTFGASLYKHSGGPNFYEFIAEDVDDYHFTLELRYNTPVNQTILIGIWSGTMQMQGLDFESLFEEVIIHVRLRVTTEKSYPSEEEVAQQVVQQVAKSLYEQTVAMEQLIKSQSRTIYMMAIILMIVVVAVIGVVVVFSVEMRKLRSLKR